jgi:hypothetical protein
MDERRKRLLGETDDADVRGEHQYPDEPQPDHCDDDDALSREPDAYVAGADGTQSVTTPDSKP